MTVPGNAESGDHTGGIVTSFVAPGAAEDGKPVVLDRRLGSRVQVRIDGELRPKLEITEVKTAFDGTLNPVGKSSMDLTYTVTNTGNVRMAAEQVVGTKGPLGLAGRKATLDRMPELLPGNSLTLSAKVPGVYPTIHTSASLRLHPVATRAGDTFGADVAPAAKTSGVWTVPWATFLMLFLLVGGPFAATWHRKRRKAAEDARVRAAVEAQLASSGS